MASSSASIIYPMAPLPNKRERDTIGADLIVTYHADLAQCEIVPAGSRYTNSGNFKAGTFLPFNQPAFIPDLYPDLLSSEDGESLGIPLILSMFNTEARKSTLQDDWEGKWFSIVARVFPNKLTFQGVNLDGWETEESQFVQVSLALPRDGGLTPDEGHPWPTTSAHASFAGPVDLDTFHIKTDVWPENLRKASVFVKLGSYILPENDRPPHKGVHVCHVLLLFPLDQQPWSSLLGWMRQATNPFPKGSWVVCSGRILGVLNRELIQDPSVVDSTVRILVILPDDWEFIRQNTLSAHTAGTSTSSNSANRLATPLRPAGPGGVASRNPFSSPSRGQKQSPQKKTSSPTTQPGPHGIEPPASPGEDHIPSNAGGTDLALAILGSNSDDSNSATDQLVDEQRAIQARTPSRKRREEGSPEPAKAKRTTAGKKKTRLYE